MESTVILHQANYKNYIRKGEKRMENIINDINIANLLKNITSEDLERMEPEKQAFVIQALLKQKKVMESEADAVIQNQKKIAGTNVKKTEPEGYYSSFCKGLL